ncbi:MAG TPA: LysM peptidoglycan-binding domain-containing protein [Planctomycetota bacterium]|jgi:nucleoid-associated protein YgaU
MKRDARIGLAVVLVLGLAVTLLVGRQLVKRGADLAEADGENPAGGTAAYSAEATRVDGAETTHIAAPASAQTNPVAEPAVRPAEAADPSVAHFVQDQTRRLGVEPPPTTGATQPQQPPVLGNVPAAQPNQPTTSTNKAANTPPTPTKSGPTDVTAPLDHEDGGPTPATGDPIAPADGYGYTIAPTDNLWKISAKVYGDGRFTQKILEANPSLSAQKMKVGSVIKIPALPNKTILMKLPSLAEAQKLALAGPAVAVNKDKEPKATKPAESGPAIANLTAQKPAEAAGETKTHKVEAGESVATIAQKYYGASGPKSVARIVDANKGLNPAKLKVGQELTIPPKK